MRMNTTHPTTTLGDRLRRTRLDADLESTEMSDLLYLHRNTVSQWENDKSRPSAKKLRQWAEIIASRTGYEAEAILTFLGVAPVTDIAERRRSDRRVAPRQSPHSSMWIFDTDTVGNESLRILPAA